MVGAGSTGNVSVNSSNENASRTGFTKRLDPSTKYVYHIRALSLKGIHHQLNIMFKLQPFAIKSFKSFLKIRYKWKISPIKLIESN